MEDSSPKYRWQDKALWTFIAALNPLKFTLALIFFTATALSLPHNALRTLWWIMCGVQAFALIVSLIKAPGHYEMIRNAHNTLSDSLEEAAREPGDNRPYERFQ